MTVSSVLNEVKPIEGRRLPERYALAHAVAFHFHDQLASLVVDLEAVGAIAVRLDLDSWALETIADLEGEELWSWLHANGHQDVIYDLTYRQLTAALVSDASHFLCESLLASGKGKTQVAYALLRKPLRENLLLLEWLACDPEDFLDRFHGESIWPYVLNRLPAEKRKDILRRTAEIVDIPGVDEDFLWTIRYVKEYSNSLETLWTKATHLVTHVGASATEPGNLNFLLSSATAIEEQWKHYYRTIPLLLHYFVAVAEEVAARFVEWDSDLRPTQLMMRHVALVRFGQEYGPSQEGRDTTAELLKELQSVSVTCGCDYRVSIGTSEVDRFWLSAEMECPSCGRTHSVWDMLKQRESEPSEAEEEPSDDVQE